MTTKHRTIDVLDALKPLWDNMTFGGLVRSLRLSDEISQIELAERLGVSKQFLNNVEHGRKNVGLTFAKKVANEMGYSIEPFIELLFREELKRNKLKYIVELKKGLCRKDFA